MSAYLEWGEFFEIGIPRIDAEHRQLVDILNEAHASLSGDEGNSFQVLNRLVRYFEEHFDSEERLMQLVHYPELIRQRIMHQKFAEAVFDYTRRWERGENEVAAEVCQFLKNWLLQHVLGEDQKIGAYCVDHEIPAEFRLVVVPKSVSKTSER